ncbi:MAG: hypothetical protein ACW98K_00055 [Candidatus Kariarchaeaceae archaeon]|jgi:hypothetical protein
MKKEDFMEMVATECEIRSQMTFTFSKIKLRKFRKWFFKKGKKYYSWSKWKCYYEWEQFIEAFNIRIQ